MADHDAAARRTRRSSPAPPTSRRPRHPLSICCACASEVDLLRLGSADLIEQKVSFPNSGTDATPGVIVMLIDDLLGDDVDPALEGALVVFNASPEATTQAIAEPRRARVRADDGAGERLRRRRQDDDVGCRDRHRHRARPIGRRARRHAGGAATLPRGTQLTVRFDADRIVDPCARRATPTVRVAHGRPATEGSGHEVHDVRRQRRHSPTAPATTPTSTCGSTRWTRAASA